MITDPVPHLNQLGVPVNVVVPSTNGYSGTYQPECVYAHWTAANRNSDTAAATVAANDYHACVSRSGVCHLGGWAVRQAHGGKGRTEPIQLARTGGMTVADMYRWQDSTAPDNTDTWPNQYGVAVSLDNDGVGEVPSPEQYDAWTATLAAFLYAIGADSTGYLLDHATSTNRKIDLTPVTPALDPAEWVPDVARHLAILHGSGPTPPEDDDVPMYQYLRDEEAGHLMLSDGMQVRWCRTEWDNDNTRAWLRRFGYPDDPMDVSRDALRLGEFGVWIGDKPPW